jgi:hypothetical protein
VHARPTSDLRLQLVPSTPVYGPQLSVGTLNVGWMTTLPVIDASRSGGRAAPAG